MTYDRCGLRGERLCPPSPLRFTPPPLPPSGVGSLHCAYGYKLSLTAAFLSAVNPQPPLAIPSRRCRYAALPPSIARTPYLSHVPPTHRGCSRLHSKPSAKPRPKRCALGNPRLQFRQSATASLTPSSLRHTARRGRT